MVKMSVAFRLRIPYIGSNNAFSKESYTLNTDVSVWKSLFDRIERGFLNE